MTSHEEKILKYYNLDKKEMIEKILNEVKPFEKRKVIRPRPSVKIYKYKENYPLDNQLINHFGGNTELSKILKVTPMAISRWRKSGIPDFRVLQLIYIYNL